MNAAAGGLKPCRRLKGCPTWTGGPTLARKCEIIPASALREKRRHIMQLGERGGSPHDAPEHGECAPVNQNISRSPPCIWRLPDPVLITPKVARFDILVPGLLNAGELVMLSACRVTCK